MATCQASIKQCFQFPRRQQIILLRLHSLMSSVTVITDDRSSYRCLGSKKKMLLLWRLLTYTLFCLVSSDQKKDVWIILFLAIFNFNHRSHAPLELQLRQKNVCTATEIEYIDTKVWPELFKGFVWFERVNINNQYLQNRNLGTAAVCFLVPKKKKNSLVSKYKDIILQRLSQLNICTFKIFFRRTSANIQATYWPGDSRHKRYFFILTTI